MIKDITIGVDLGAVVSSGPYENLKPSFSFSVTYKDVSIIPEKQFELDLNDAEKATQIAYERLYKQIEYCEAQAMQKAIEKFHKGIHWYTDEKTGERWPGVTSVIDFANPIEWFVSKEKLRGLASRGQVVDMILQEYIKDGVWKSPEQIPDAIRHLAIMKDMGYETKGSQWTTAHGNLPAFVEKFGVKFISGHKYVTNRKDKYGGQIDAICTIGDDPTLVLADLKSFNPDSKGVIRTFKQISAYIMACETKCEKMAIFPVHDGNKQGFSKPVISSNIDEHYKMFLSDRKVFKETFNV